MAKCRPHLNAGMIKDKIKACPVISACKVQQLLHQVANRCVHMHMPGNLCPNCRALQLKRRGLAKRVVSRKLKGVENMLKLQRRRVGCSCLSKGILSNATHTRTQTHAPVAARYY